MRNTRLVAAGSCVWEVPEWGPLPVRAGVTRRIGGFSTGVYQGLNLGLHVGDDPEIVYKNRVLAAATFGLPTAETQVWLNQVHGDHVAVVTAEDGGRGLSSLADVYGDFDAAVTNQQGVTLCIGVADCVPVLLYDARCHAMGAVHAGWRGVAQDLCRKTLCVMAEEYGTQVEDVYAFVGPAIGPLHFEVSAQVAREIIDTVGESAVTEWYQRDEEDKAKVDLKLGLVRRLQGIGIHEDRIALSETDTVAEATCYSYRRDAGVTGRMALLASLDT